jgi:hypothetical protein
MAAHPSPKAFISYTRNPTTGPTQTSQTGERHKLDVRWLSDTLRRFGITTVLDQYKEDDPPPNWPQWMEDNIKRCQWVLMICSEAYLSHITSQSAATEEGGVNEGRGSRFQGKTIYGLLMDDQQANKFIPVFLGEKNLSWLPPSLLGVQYYHIEDMQTFVEFERQDPGFKNLYARLTGQNRNPPPPVGEIVPLPAQNSTGTPTTGSQRTTNTRETAGMRRLGHPSDDHTPFNPGTNIQSVNA